MTEMSTENLAVLSALVSTGVAAGVFAIELLRLWEKRPRLHISVRTGMTSIGSPATDGQTVMFVTITNRGFTPTTITSLHFTKYSNRIYSILNIQKRCVKVPFVRVSGLDIGNLPSEIGANQQWSGVYLQSSQIEEMIKKFHILVMIGVTHRDKPVMSGRVTLDAYGTEITIIKN